MTQLKKATTAQAEFRTVGQSGVLIAETPANHKGSMSILQQNGLRPLTYQEALVKLCQDQELKEQLKGKFFYLAGGDSALSGYHTVNDKGELIAGKGDGDIEKTVYAWNGPHPLSLHVHTDEVASYVERRFAILAYDCPSLVAPVVVGVRIGHEAAVQNIEASDRTKIDSELKDRLRTAVAKVDGVLDSEITAVFKEVLGAME